MYLWGYSHPEVLHDHGVHVNRYGGVNVFWDEGLEPIPNEVFVYIFVVLVR